MKALVFLTLLSLAVAKVSYEDFHGISVTTPDEDSINFVNQLAHSTGTLVLLDPSKHRDAELAVPPAAYETFKQELEQGGIVYVDIYDNLQEKVDQQQKESRLNYNMAGYRSGGKYDFTIATYFPTYNQSIEWIEDLARNYPALATIEVIGQSLEGRNQTLIKIGNPSDSPKKAIWIDAAIHAREWATVPTVLYTASKLLAYYDSTDESISTKHLLDKFDFYLMPVFNPDGYVHTHSEDRFWRKNRRPLSGTDYFGRPCYGVDLNRNFGHEWGVSGVSFDECDPSYLGPEPFSEIETQNARDKWLSLKGRFEMYINLHAYGQLLFYPYAYDSGVLLNEAARKEHIQIATAIKQAIFGTGYKRTSYRVGKAGDLIYNAAGGTFDWVYAKADARVAFAAELSPSLYRGRGLGGFEVSPNEMPEIAEEVYRGLKAAAEAL